MARTRKFVEKEALNALKNVFWRKGFEGASYDDLMSATSLGKGSLYAAFGDKRSVYLRALTSYVEDEVEAAVDLLMGVDKQDAPLTKKKLSGVKRIDALLSIIVEEAERQDNAGEERKGCFLCNAAIDVAPHDKDVEALTLKGLDAMRQGLVDALSEVVLAKRRKLVAEHLLATYLGMRMMARSGVSSGQLILVKKAAVTDLR